MQIDDENFKKLHISTDLDIDYTELDHQKGCNSPRELFKQIIDDKISKNHEFKIYAYSKEKECGENNYKDVLYKSKEDEEVEYKDFQQINCKSICLDKYSFYDSHIEDYLDYVNELYFSTPFLSKMKNNINKCFPINKKKNEDIDTAFGSSSNRFKFTSLDFLLNPLRTSLPFERWSPYEIALFEACICKFGKDFELFKIIIKTKNLDEIQEFYYCWEKSKYYDSWVTTQIKKGKYPNKLF